ncbi:hypothetical protein Gotri_019785, partial [Gossypium trilobum]|nr:hypothetical protein [Gossypium trilobum]
DSVRIDEGFVADGGYVRDYNGEWIIRFSRYLGNCTMLEAELWGILNGLNLILDRRFENTLIQTDCIEAINAIMEDSSGNSNSALVRRTHHTLKMFKQWKIQHIPREENLIADSLAKTIQTRRIGLRLHRLGSFNVILTGVAAVAAAVAAAAVDDAAGSGVDHGAAVFIGVFAVVGTQH